MRAHDARFYWEYMGAHFSPSSEEDVFEGVALVQAHTLGPRGVVAPGVLATIADIALAMSIRPTVPPRHRTATFGLTVQILRETSTSSVRARSQLLSSAEHAAVARCSLLDDLNTPLAVATGTFAIRPVPGGGPWLPYSNDRVISASDFTPVDPDGLSEVERSLLERVEGSLARSEPDGTYAAYLGIEWEARGEGSASGEWAIGPHVWNRVAHVHGGALFGAMSVAALACLPDSAGARVVEQHVQYVRPGIGDMLQVEASILRKGQMLTSVQARVLDLDGDVVAGALVTLEGNGNSVMSS